jgi:hypothetical protein
VIWFSPGNPVSSNKKTDRHDIAEILLKMSLNTITLALAHQLDFWLIKYIFTFYRKAPMFTHIRHEELAIAAIVVIL